MSRNMCILVLGLCALAALAAPVGADSEMVTVVRLSDSIEIAAPPAKVWAAMTGGDLSWCPYWKGDANKGHKLSKVGDVLEFKDEWGNGGSSVVTYFEPDVELRIANEPDDGSYMCQSRLVLEEMEGATTVTYIEQYTDESSDEDMEATANSMEAAITKTLMTLKRVAEKK